MAFPTGWTRKCRITIQGGQVPANQTAFPVLITEACLPDEMKTSGGGDAAQSNGGDIRFTTDAAGTSRLACELVRWVQNATPSLAKAEIWVPVDVLTGSDVDIYVWYSAGGSESQPAANAAFGSEAVWDANYKGVWHFPDGTTLTAGDSTANANNGTIGSGVTAVAGKIDGGASFSSGEISKSNNSGLQPTVFTIEFWIKTTQTGNTVVVEKDGNNGFSVQTDTTNSIGLKVNVGGATLRIGINTTHFSADGAWHHVAFVYFASLGSGQSANNHALVDGVDHVDFNNPSVPSYSTGVFDIGSRGGSFGCAMDMDELRLSNSARSTNWITTEYNSQSAPGSFAVVGTPESAFGQSCIPTAIGSDEAFGSPTIVAGEATVEPTGIASGEAFGSPTLDAPGGFTVIPDGIASAEAFGSPALSPGAAPISPAGIPSEEAFGRDGLDVVVSARLRFLISGVDRTDYLHHESDFSWNLMKGSRGSCSLPLIVEPGDPFAPQVGELIEIFDPAALRVWAGTVEQVFVKWIGNAGDHLFVLTGVTLESLFDTAFVDKTRFDGVSAASAFSDLYDASGVTAVTLGDVETGETIEALEVTRISDGFATIALRSNLIWFVDPSDLTVNLISALARSAPWVMGSDDMLWETMQWRQSRADFRDTQVIQAPDGTSQTILAVTPNASIGRRSARLTLTTSYTSPGAIQEATAALKRFSTFPSQLVISTDRPGVSLGMVLELDPALPLESEGLLAGLWQVQEVEARLLTGMDRVYAGNRRLPPDLQLGHFRYTLHLVNTLAAAIFQGDGETTVFTLPVTPGSIASITVSPHPELYSTSSLGADVTITPAMPPGTHALVGYQGDATPDTGTFLDTWTNMSPVAASAGPASGGGGTGAQKFIADATLRDLTIQDDAGPHAIVYADGTGSRVLVVLRQVLGADLVVRINLNGTELLTVTIDSGTAVDDVLEFPMSARAFTVTIASPGVLTVAGATLADDDTVVLHTTGALPTGLVDETTYYVVNSSGSTFELATTPGGTSIDTSGSQSGKHWLTSDAIPAPAFADKDVLTYDVLDSDGAIDTTPGGFLNLTVEWE